MKKKQLTESEYAEMIRELESAKHGKESRAFHKKYKKYGHGLLFGRRYPYFRKYFALHASIAAIIIQILGWFLKALGILQ